MSRPLLLDLFCGAGGSAEGYYRAGFDVIGVDLAPQPHYPFSFYQANALDPAAWPLPCAAFRAIHASPPCQAYSRARALRGSDRRDDHPRLIEPTRKLLQLIGLPYVIENVPGAPLIDPVQLCGSFFGLGGDGFELRRHRLFESSVPIEGTPCRHNGLPAISIIGHGESKVRRAAIGRNPRIAEKRAAMGIDWTNRDELSEAIPPVFTEYVGRQLIERITT